MKQSQLAKLLKWFPIFAIGIITDRFFIRAWETDSPSMMCLFLVLGVVLAHEYWGWLTNSEERNKAQ